MAKGTIKGPKVHELMTTLGFGYGGELQKLIDSDVIRLSDPFVPSDTTALRKSAILKTEIGSGLVIYSVYGNPRGRNTYNDVTSEFQDRPKRGPFWVHRMLDAGGWEKIAKNIMEHLKKHGS